MLHKVGGGWPLTARTSGCESQHSHWVIHTSSPLHFFWPVVAFWVCKRPTQILTCFLIEPFLLFCCDWCKMKHSVTAESHRQLTWKYATVLWSVVHCTTVFCIELSVKHHQYCLQMDSMSMKRWVKVWNWSLLKCFMADEPAEEYCHRHHLENATQMHR